MARCIFWDDHIEEDEAEVMEALECSMPGPMGIKNPIFFRKRTHLVKAMVSIQPLKNLHL